MSITSSDYIKINGVSSDTVGLYIDTPPMPPMQVPVFQQVTIPGRAEQLTFKEASMEDIQIDISAYLFSDTDSAVPNEIYAYLCNAETLVTSKSSDFYYKVRRVLNVSPTYKGHGKQYLQLSFICSPFRYSATNTTITNSNSEFWIVNNGSYYCQPTYRLNGNGTLTLEVNDDTSNKLVIENVQGYVIVDAEKLIVHKDGTFKKSKGQIPFFAVGNNKIKHNATSIEITKNERWV